MLEELEVRDLGPIHHALLCPAAGMTAITGETGAGKSMLLNAIRLISGSTARPQLVSPGAHESWVQGIFDAGRAGAENPVTAAISEAGLPSEDEGQIFLARTMPVKGRSRAALNGRTAPRGLLEEVAGMLVTVHGQADQMRMASPARQREFLDAYAGDGPQLEAFSKAFRQYRQAQDHLEELRNQQSGAMAQADYLRESIARIDRVDPHSGEDRELKAQRDRIEHAAQISQGVMAALSALDSGQIDPDADAPSATALVERAIAALEGIGVEGVFQESAQRLRSLNADLSDLVFTLSSQLDDEGQEGDLDKINARIHDLDELTRRWGPDIDDVLAWRKKAAFELEDMDASPEKLEELEGQVEQLRGSALKAARNLSVSRGKAARRLSELVDGELRSLAMAGAGLEIRVRPRQDQDMDGHGLDQIDFLFRPYPGSDLLPMGKSASGGELSRLMLALELVAAEGRTSSRPDGSGHGHAGRDSQVGDPTMTFIFDEVDAGVGGRAAVELGRRLARLAVTAQVIVVTHLPQVASWADRQFVVAKGREGGDAVETLVRQVEGEDREREIARMLAGSESTTSLKHARELLSSSRLQVR
ncbi:DNA repair protein RecN [Bifidobacterium sp. W8106]|uniref:DNA repair protein RecN n=1 Tax=Bifidobacterium TaxID=1678 RepID=UPI0018DB5E6B|nr:MULTISPECIES: DNA repair protein RecN [Bifidobacterium]MBI0142491.1 DNA repair protein RecN [Bifidobacterium choladohabitans]MBI0146491.1 DNA repair protein RecN [Bifidobacterium sp. W8104]